MTTAYTKNDHERIGCCSKAKYYTFDNLYKYAGENAQRETASAKTVAESFCSSCNNSMYELENLKKEEFCSKGGCQAPNTMLYQPVRKIDCTCCNGKVNNACWIGVL